MFVNPWLVEGGLFGPSIGSENPKKSVLLFPFEDILGVLQIFLLEI